VPEGGGRTAAVSKGSDVMKAGIEAAYRAKPNLKVVAQAV